MINTYDMSISYVDHDGMIVQRSFYGISRVAVKRYENYYSGNYSLVNSLYRPSNGSLTTH